MCIFVILVTFFIINSISGLYYDDLNKHYRIYTFDTNGKVCSPSGVKEKLEITDKNRSAIFLTQSKLNDRRKINFDCKFTVDATPFDVISKFKNLFMKEDENLGLFAVIQYMDLRYDEERGECIDYIQFKVRGKPYGDKLCGHYNIGNTMSNRDTSNEVSRLAFVSDSGAIDTHIFIDKRSLNYHEHLELKIVYTAYRKCSLSTDFCGSSYNGKCIPIEYFNDGLVNCPYSSCSDEKFCEIVARNLEDLVSAGRPGDIDSETTSTNTKVTIGAVTTLLVSFMMFIVCVWCCKKWSKLCWAEDCVSPRTQEHSSSNVRSQQPGRTIELENRSEASVPTISPTAPPIDKDLPPSYDSLFPSRNS